MKLEQHGAEYKHAVTAFKMGKMKGINPAELAGAFMAVALEYNNDLTADEALKLTKSAIAYTLELVLQFREMEAKRAGGVSDILAEKIASVRAMTIMNELRSPSLLGAA